MRFIFLIFTFLFASDISLLNEFRLKAGLNVLRMNRYLNESAQNHAKYLYYNHFLGHYEKDGYSYFTGETPFTRVIFVGYPSRFVVENISKGQKNFNESIENLFSAIYHRLGFLNFNVNEIGYAKVGDVFVYNLGNSVISEYCNENSARSGFIVCKDKSRLVPKEVFYSIQKQNAKVILWPYHGMREVPVVFYEEHPDPLPDYGVSGYPISISFNPSYYQHIKLLSFKLFNEDKEITNTLILTSKNDVNHKLSENDFVLFPLERLELNSIYKVVAKFIVDGNVKTFSWHFFTKREDTPIIEVENLKDTFYIKSNKLYIIYFKPLNANDTIFRIKTKYQGVTIEKFVFKDSNSVYLKVRGKGYVEIFANNRDVKFKVK